MQIIIPSPFRDKQRRRRPQSARAFRMRQQEEHWLTPQGRTGPLKETKVDAASPISFSFWTPLPLPLILPPSPNSDSAFSFLPFPLFYLFICCSLLISCHFFVFQLYDAGPTGFCLGLPFLVSFQRGLFFALSLHLSDAYCIYACNCIRLCMNVLTYINKLYFFL